MDQKRRPRVLLADDHIGMLTALQRMLEPSCEIVGRVTDGSAVLDAAGNLKPDVIVLDLFMPNVNGLAACLQIKNMVPQTRIVILSGVNDSIITEKALTFGASAFVLKSSVAHDLLGAIRSALVGGTFASVPN